MEQRQETSHGNPSITVRPCTGDVATGSDRSRTSQLTLAALLRAFFQCGGSVAFEQAGTFAKAAANSGRMPEFTVSRQCPWRGVLLCCFTPHPHPLSPRRGEGVWFSVPLNSLRNPLVARKRRWHLPDFQDTLQHIGILFSRCRKPLCNPNIPPAGWRWFLFWRFVCV